MDRMGWHAVGVLEKFCLKIYLDVRLKPAGNLLVKLGSLMHTKKMQSPIFLAALLIDYENFTCAMRRSFFSPSKPLRRWSCSSLVRRSGIDSGILAEVGDVRRDWESSKQKIKVRIDSLLEQTEA